MAAGAERWILNGPMVPQHRSLAGELWNGSRALGYGRALGCVSRGAIAVGMAMKVDAMVAH